MKLEASNTLHRLCYNHLCMSWKILPLLSHSYLVKKHSQLFPCNFNKLQHCTAFDYCKLCYAVLFLLSLNVKRVFRDKTHEESEGNFCQCFTLAMQFNARKFHVMLKCLYIV